MSDIAALILAAGGSTRLGSPKQLLKYQRETLIYRATHAALLAGCEPVVAVLGAKCDEMRRALAGLNMQVALNPNWERGIGSSIRVGMQSLLQHCASRPAAVLICLCDQPLVDAAVLRRLMDARAELQMELCVSTYDDTIGPPVLAGAEYFDELLSLADAQGAKSLWTRDGARCAKVPCPGAATDIDTRADVVAFRARHGV